MNAAVAKQGEPRFQEVAPGETMLRVTNLKKYFPVTEGMIFQKIGQCEGRR